MAKFLLFVLIGILLYLLLTRSKRAPSDKHESKLPTDEAMVRCAYCGVHVPAGESLLAGDKRYCCEEHRRLGQ